LADVDAEPGEDFDSQLVAAAVAGPTPVPTLTATAGVLPLIELPFEPML